MEAERVRMNHVAHAVVLQAGSRVTLRDTRMTIGHPRAVSGSVNESIRAALTMGENNGDAGPARAQLERCSVPGASRGFRVLGGSMLCAVLCEAEVHEEAVRVEDSESRAVLRCCTARSAQHGCIVRSSGAALRLEWTEVVAWKEAVSVHNSARLVAVESGLTSLASGSVYAVNIQTNAVAVLLRCRLAAVEACVGCAGVVSLKQCHVSEAHAAAADGSQQAGSGPGMAYACYAGEMSVEGGTVAGEDIGILLHYGAKGRIADVEVSGCRHALICMEGCSVAVDRCRFRGPTPEVLRTIDARRRPEIVGLMLSGVRGVVRDCAFAGFHSGVHFESPGEIRKCEFMDTLQGGECVKAVSDTVVVGCQFVHSHRAVVVKKGCTSVRGCRFGPGLHRGVDGWTGSDVAVSGSRFIDCEVAMGVGRGCQLNVQGSSCKGCGHGIWAHRGGYTVTAARLTVARGGTAVFATAAPDEAGDVKVVDSTLTGAEVGFSISGRQVTGSLVRCYLKGCVKGVSVAASANATLCELRVSGGQDGVVVGCVDELLMDKCEVCGRQGRSARAAAWSALRNAPMQAHESQENRPRCAHEGGVACMTMEDCEVRGCAERGLQVNTHGHLTARRVRAAECGVGFAEYFLRARSEFVECSAAGCDRRRAAVGFRQGSADAVTEAVPEDIAGIRIDLPPDSC